MGNWLYISKKNNIQSLPNPSSFVNVNIKKQYEFKKMPGYSPQAGFDNSALMQDPKYKQMETMNQGMEVSEPYLEANKIAFSKNNPMNAISQETPVGDRVDEFLGRMGQ